MTAIPGSGLALDPPVKARVGATPHDRAWIVRHVLIGAGCLALALAILLPTYVYNQLAVLPADPQREQLLIATGATALVPDVNIPAGAKVEHNLVVRIANYVAQAPQTADDGSVVWRIGTTVNVDGEGMLDARAETISLDRHTAKPTNCCGDRLVTSQEDTNGKPLKHEGYLSFPFNTQKHTYQLWDVQLNGTRTATYVGQERRDDLKTYRFQSAVAWTKIGTREVPGAMFGVSAPGVVADSEYADTRTYWIEPVTGSVVAMHDELRQRLSYQGTSVTALSADLDSPRLSDDEWNQAHGGALVLPWLRVRGPIILVILGLALIGLGLVLRFRAGSPGRHLSHP
jgi:hypothetical protein